ncbi:GBF-interacting protein 1-like isoform X1 [Cynara cardunculus var. scolymus]|uniref:GBF-interacting protein 1-like isoform X1 n=1 Tax=Cynara cardunculus var. scolymus TaxID=59895 RepID=UPI000D629C9D|nr:GBF-interacting protein 1-like isoform X1 [Cynara cardunculus var. scolymus]
MAAKTTMNGGAADARVSIPTHHRKVIQEIKKTLGFKHSDEFIHATLNDCDMDPNEAGWRLKMIHDIREIAGKHSVEDVYIMLKDCNMDPNEAAQRLLYIDTFHEVKKKHDRRKPISSDTSEEHKRTRGNQWQGAKGGRGTFYSSKVFDDVGGGRTLSSGKDNGVANPPERVSGVTPSVHSGKENNGALVANSAANANGTVPISNGSYINKLAPELSPDVSSSTSDPVVIPYENTHHTCAVGTIKCEITKRSGSSKSNAKLPAGIKSSVDQVVAGVAEAVDSDSTSQPQSNVVEKNQMSDVLQPLSVSTNKGSHVVNPNQDNQPSRLLNEPPKVTASEHMNVAINNAHLVPGAESELKRSDPKLDVMLEKLTLSSHQPVIFPDHFEVPENFRSQFTFGSLDATPDDCRPLSVIEATQPNGEVVTEPSSSNENVAKTAQEGEVQDHPLPHLSEHALPSKDDISSHPAIKHEQTKLEAMPPIGGFQNPVLQASRDYPFGFMPHLVGPHFVQLDVPELQSGSSQVASALGSTPVAQSTTTGQSSMALSPPLFPYFRQPYPNYIPYNPYFPHMYLPQHAHLLNHGIFPQQPPTGNIYMHPAAAGVKFPVPSQYKQGSNAGSLTHVGVSSGYGSYGSSVGYDASVTPGSSANEDLTASQTKDNDLHSAQQGDDPQVYAPAADRDTPNLLPNYFYNFPQPQHMAFSLLQAGIYHSSPMTAQTTVQPPVYPPQSTGGTVEPMVSPPPSSYQQPQSNWNTALLNRETS